LPKSVEKPASVILLIETRVSPSFCAHNTPFRSIVAVLLNTYLFLPIGIDPDQRNRVVGEDNQETIDTTQPTHNFFFFSFPNICGLYKACDSKCHFGAWGSKCEYLVGSIQSLNMSSAPLSLLLSAELNHSIARHRVQNGITKHVIQNGISGHVVQNAN
jgi:hypothetical protein